ncbi:hypothetical protein TRIATDRAFT_289969 [Trichoderma atroviride IMI 206040]|uniref:Uncharacterized protein n=1 Tax=Hypocrea atroviridis (strain ATCC 20476 / IMI 206040) TaxID=452589 RepID=G9NJU7_HYPAI|nr:uncharacterized protein TRIATDRAFT_289969 [Trichoderma atroviride IMI 206040]EHK49169.1 hypothetical protein TRIATDRAFT_289969 [Trichoderma atroviride IMI 206040]
MCDILTSYESSTHSGASFAFAALKTESRLELNSWLLMIVCERSNCASQPRPKASQS